MDVKITPSRLSGEVDIPSSKSMTHRVLICAALAEGESVISNVTFSQDIYATIDALKACGAEISVSGSTVTVRGISGRIPKNADIDCCESGSTLRFMIPVTAALGINAVYKGRGRLPERPITPYLRELAKKGIRFDYNNTMPFSVEGKLTPGRFDIEGDISSQFITGLLFALPLLDGDSEIEVTSKLESRPYAEMTVSCLRRFGVEAQNKTGCEGYIIRGGQKYQPGNIAVEGDYSQAAFFCVANAMGSSVKMNNLLTESCQGDKKIVEIINGLCYNKNGGFDTDASDIPDLVPILGVLGTFCQGTSYIRNAARLRIKESDRLETTAAAINALGGRITVTQDGLVIEHAKLKGGIVDSAGDHRIAMSAAIAATVCSEPVIIKNADSVRKSYPGFFEDYKNLGGIANGINLE